MGVAHRCKVVEYTHELCSTYDLGAETTWLAVRLFDRYAAAVAARRGHVSTAGLQSTAGVCVVLAAKYVECCSFSFAEVARDCDVTVSAIVLHEAEVLAALEWRMQTTTPLSLAQGLLAHDLTTPLSHDEEARARKLAEAHLIAATFESALLGVSSAALSVSAVGLALEQLDSPARLARARALVSAPEVDCSKRCMLYRSEVRVV